MRCHVRFWALTVPAILLTISALTTRQVEAGFDLGPAGNYGVLVGQDAKNLQLNNSTVFGNVGVGLNLSKVAPVLDGIQITSNGFIMPAPGQPGSGRLDLADPPFVVANQGNVSGGVFFSQSQVTTAINYINALSSTLGSESGTALVINGGGQIVNASSGMLDGGGNRVFSLTAASYSNNNQGFTVVGGASDFVVFNINNGTSNEALGGPISLSGGITSDHVLFNFVGTSGNLGASAGGATVNGVFLAPNMKINLDNVTINGRLFGGRAGQDFQIVSGFMLNQPLIVPEPSSLVLLGLGGLGGVLLSCRLLGGGRRRAA